jgi:murein DD-endopeptidase MepM/ murein hydrolase activator NlpD
MAACLAALAASLLACNLPTGGITPPTLGPIPPTATVEPVPPTASPTLPEPTAPGLPTTTPVPIEAGFPMMEPPGAMFQYTTRSGDTLPALALRFGVEASQIAADTPLSPVGYLPAGLALRIPNVLEAMTPGGEVLPDSEVVFSPAAADFDVSAFVAATSGYLSRYSETMEDETVLSGAEIVRRVAEENSINPRLLLALLEFRAGYIYGVPQDADQRLYPLGFSVPDRPGLYQELSVACSQLARGYYGWRQGTLTETRPDDGGTVRWNPTLNAGSVAVLHVFALLTGTDGWMDQMVGPRSFVTLYASMFGEPHTRPIEALLPPDLAQPALELPFGAGEGWSLTAGPHPAWTAGTPRGALDLSPITAEDPCAVSFRWVTASAPGVIARARDNAVALDLDGDGNESTGWVLLYYHLAEEGMIAPGTRVATGDRLGHPSCQGGRSTGKHVHVARKFNGEWLAADGPVPFVLSGWRAVADARNYYGSLVRGAEVVTSDSSGQRGSTIVR